MGRGEHLRGAGGVALPVVEAVGAEVAEVEHGVDLGGGRSSGELGVGVREHGRRSWCMRSAPRSTVRTETRSKRAEAALAATVTWHGGGEIRARRKRWLEGENEL